MPVARKTLLVSSSLFFLLLCVSLTSLASGAVSIPLIEIIRYLTGGSLSDEHQTILFAIRLPRVLLAALVGGALSVAGAVFQALLRNPLAEPFILGISSGGTLGAVIVIALGLASDFLLVPIGSFAGSLAVMILVYSMASRYGRIDPTTLLLGGVVVGAFFNALILTFVAVFHREVQQAFLWLMGNLSSADLSSLAVVGPPVLASSLVIVLLSRFYNVIAVGDETATQLGINIETIKRTSYLLASLITGLVVSVSGVIGFVGLIVPHTCRLIFGPDHRVLVPASFFLGATFLVLVDLFARTIIAPAEIPVGAVTAVVGAPVFVWLLRRRS